MPRRRWFPLLLSCVALGVSMPFAAHAQTTELPPPPRDRLRGEADLHLGVSTRLGDAPTGDVTEPSGLALGVTALVLPMRWVAVGAGYEHVDLGKERSDVSAAGVVDVRRDLNTLWLLARFYAMQNDALGIYLALGAGLAWQHADATGIVFGGTFGTSGAPFQCSGSASGNLALRVAAGGEGHVVGGLRVFGELAFDNDRLSSDVLDDCAVGVGTVGSLALHAGLSYRFDIPGVR